ncbi:MAG: hypothetical protein CMD68_04400 [Gammaproteobacteria bacterium]|nr:hypothetical protein [Gammaproteobacteria bacterium]|tara:strand:+ start:37 stop:324 length:288 start_codon:yes stop_codon:yes gene_type:complete
MKESYKDIADALNTLYELENDLNIRHLNPNELKVFYTIINLSAFNEVGTNISDIVKKSGMSRSTVYKTLKKLLEGNIILMCQSQDDGRESLVTLN